MRIEVGPHYSKLLDIPDIDLEEQIRSELSYELPGAEFTKQKFIRRGSKMVYNPRYQANTTKYLYDKKTRKFPSGLLGRVEALIPGAVITYPSTPKPTGSTNLSRQPRYYQQDAITSVLANPRGVIILPTGTGKTLVCAMLAMAWPDQTILVTVPNLNLLNQSHAELGIMTGLEIGILGDDQCNLRRVTVATIQSLISRQSEPMIKAFLKSTTVWVADECHGVAADSYIDLSKLLVNCYNRIGVTATWMREDGKELLMEGVIGPVVYNYTIDKAMSDGYLTPVDIILRHVKHTPITILPKPKYKQVYKQCITENDTRSQLIIAQDVADLVAAGKTPCLVIVDEIEHGKRLASLLGAPFISGQEKSRDKRKQILDDFESGKNPILVGSSVMNVGVDVPTIKSMVNAAGGKSLTLLLQRIGRSLRIHPSKESVTYIDYFDHQSLYLEDHANVRRYFYNQYFGGVKEITSEPLS